jgi:hypothetical protein
MEDVMPENKQDAIPSPPKPRSIIYARDDFHVVQIYSRYRGKTNGYFVDRTCILSIMDKLGKVVEGKWKDDLVEVAPGIETRRGNLIERQRLGDHSYESAMTACVCIHRNVCPVHIEFRDTMEYNDYDDYRYSSSETVVYWIRYEA